MITKEKLDYAVKQVVENCLSAKKGERACVITDNETKHIGLAIANKLKSVGCIVTSFIMEDFGKRPEDGKNSLKFPEDPIGKSMDESDISVYAAQGKTNEYPSFRTPMLVHLDKNDKLRHAHMISITDPIMEEGMCADYKEVVRLSNKIGELVSRAKEIKVTTQKGTNIVVKLDPKLKWVVGSGLIKPKHWDNLPGGEVFTCPQNVDGTVIVDGVLGDYMSEKYGLIEDNPITLAIKDGYITSVICSNKTIEDDVKKYFAQAENSNRIGEIGIGTNTGVTKLIGNLLQDEKFPGVHIAAGYPHPEKTGATWTVKSHFDMVIQKTNIEVDGTVIMKEGKYLI